MNSMFVRTIAYLVMLGIGSAIPASAQSPEIQASVPDYILHNGKILTVDSSFSTAEAVAVTGNQITAVGSNEAVLRVTGPGTEVIDLRGRTVIPGLIDTHVHFHNYAESAYGSNLAPDQLLRYPLDWRAVVTKEDVLNQIKAWMDRYQFEPGRWVYFDNGGMFTGGRGSAELAEILYEEINRWELDTVAPNNPIALSLGIPYVNGILVNSKALDIIWDEDFFNKYGRYWRDEQGRPDGHLEPPASRLALEHVMNRPPQVLAPLYKAYIEEMAASGVTSASSRFPPETLRAFDLLESRGEMILRISYGKEEVFGTVKNPETDLAAFRNVAGTGNDKMWITSVAPSAVDGSTTRACTNQRRLQAYGPIDAWWPVGQCHNDNEFRGAAGKGAPSSANYYREWTMQSALNGVRFANTHVGGDRSVSLLLDMVEDLQAQAGPDVTKGWAFDHCFMVDPDDFARAARLGIAFSCAPKYVQSGPLVAAVYGDEVANTFIDPVKSMLDAGLAVSFESDRDVYVWYDLELLLTRKDRNGKVWGAHEAVDRVTALKMATRWAADYVLRPDKLGSLEPGKLADLVVLDKDYMTIPAEEISELRPQLTMLDGRVIFLHPEFVSETGLEPNGAVVATYEQLKERRTTGVRLDF
jgi:predicted amidohydrolase YtcJ